MLTWIVSGWIMCGVLAFGLTLAHFENQFPQFAYKDRRGNLTLAFAILVGGPLGLISALLGGGIKYGLRFKPMSREESEAAHRREYPNLPINW